MLGQTLNSVVTFVTDNCPTIHMIWLLRRGSSLRQDSVVVLWAPSKEYCRTTECDVFILERILFMELLGREDAMNEQLSRTSSVGDCDRFSDLKVPTVFNEHTGPVYIRFHGVDTTDWGSDTYDLNTPPTHQPCHSSPIYGDGTSRTASGSTDADGNPITHTYENGMKWKFTFFKLERWFCNLT